MFPYFWSNYSTVQIRMSAIDVGLNSDAYAACSKHNLQASATQEIQTRLKRYYFPSNALKFEDARAACRKHFNWGGDIASIETEEENNFVNKYVLHGKQAWIGCVKNGGSWIWAESESLCFEDNEDWNHILHPSEGAGKCAYYWNSNFVRDRKKNTFASTDCDGVKRRYLCEDFGRTTTSTTTTSSTTISTTTTSTTTTSTTITSSTTTTTPSTKTTTTITITTTTLTTTTKGPGAECSSSAECSLGPCKTHCCISRDEIYLTCKECDDGGNCATDTSEPEANLYVAKCEAGEAYDGATFNRTKSIPQACTPCQPGATQDAPDVCTICPEGQVEEYTIAKHAGTCAELATQEKLAKLTSGSASGDESGGLSTAGKITIPLGVLGFIGGLLVGWYRLNSDKKAKEEARLKQAKFQDDLRASMLEQKKAGSKKKKKKKKSVKDGKSAAVTKANPMYVPQESEGEEEGGSAGGYLEITTDATPASADEIAVEELEVVMIDTPASADEIAVEELEVVMIDTPASADEIAVEELPVATEETKAKKKKKKTKKKKKKKTKQDSGGVVETEDNGLYDAPEAAAPHKCGWKSAAGRTCAAMTTNVHCGRHMCTNPDCANGKESAATVCDMCDIGTGGFGEC